MQRYYRTVMDVSLLNELLLQLFREAILTRERAAAAAERALPGAQRLPGGACSDGRVRAHARRRCSSCSCCCSRTRRSAACAPRPCARSRGNLWLIDEEFRQNPRNHRLFLEILRAPVGVTHELRRMNTYGVLGRYIPAFGRIVGRMQYDLFHAYTVDAHTLFVREQPAPPRDAASTTTSCRSSRGIMQQLPKPEIAYLAALFHDIAKGRGGDHSELGSVDAEAFCLEQGLSRYDARLVAWLVRNHLLLSVTAQKQDIADPQVINDFARQVGDETHLDYLYVLTCADVRGTNPKLWNSWKASLFHEFYERVKRGAAPRPREPDRPGTADPREPGRRARAARRSRASRRRRSTRDLGATLAGATSCGTRPRRSPGTRACSPRATRRRTIRWWPWSRAANAAPRRC